MPLHAIRTQCLPGARFFAGHRAAERERTTYLDSVPSGVFGRRLPLDRCPSTEACLQFNIRAVLNSYAGMLRRFYTKSSTLSGRAHSTPLSSHRRDTCRILWKSCSTPCRQ